MDPESEKRRGPSIKGNLFLNKNAAETVYDRVTRTHLQGRTENETHQGESSMWPLANYGSEDGASLTCQECRLLLHL